jgi:glucokinase
MLLAGDIGGTKTDLAIYSFEGGPRAPLAEAEFRSGDYPSLEAIAREFIERTGLPVKYASFDIAGPVLEGHAKVTNLTWEVDTEELERSLGLKSVGIINDLEAIALAVPELQPHDLQTLNEGDPVDGGSVAVIAPGTGLGEAYLTWEGVRYHAHPSEGGHADFAPCSPNTLGLVKYLMNRFKHVSAERVCSGKGIPNIYDYLRDSGFAPEHPTIASRLAEAKDRTPIIMQEAISGEEGCALCKGTLDLFVEALAAETGNLALKVLSTGGVYIGGGVPRHILPGLDREAFMRSFLNKGRMNKVLSAMPVFVITKPKIALLGAAGYGLRMVSDDERG